MAQDARKLSLAICDAARYGDGILTAGEQALLDYLTAALRERTGDALGWAVVASETWKRAAATVDEERA